MVHDLSKSTSTSPPPHPGGRGFGVGDLRFGVTAPAPPPPHLGVVQALGRGEVLGGHLRVAVLPREQPPPERAAPGGVGRPRPEVVARAPRARPRALGVVAVVALEPATGLRGPHVAEVPVLGGVGGVGEAPRPVGLVGGVAAVAVPPQARVRVVLGGEPERLHLPRSPREACRAGLGLGDVAAVVRGGVPEVALHPVGRGQPDEVLEALGE
mmetsp:Transcript_1134/g.4627  ORF Transcript_1134/g.4627 Transcript_1134/m.4627 type:complete len:212 (+) Transcript_1134:337-972(+)